MQRFLAELPKQDGGLATYGEAEVRKALEAGAVSHLLLAENLRKWRVTFTNSKTGEVEQKTVPQLQLDAAYAEMSKKWGGTHTQMEKRDLVEELSDLAESSGTDVHIVSGASEEGGMLGATFGGVVALLRYKV